MHRYLRLNAIAVAALSLASCITADLEPRAAATASGGGGYLVTAFHGSDQSIYQYLSIENDPGAFQALNDGKPILTAKAVGTRGVRDPFLASNGKMHYIIGTDLNIDRTNWDAARRHGSRGVLVWSSPDLIKWDGPHLVPVEDDTAGMVWAPSAIFVGGTFHMFWSSRHYPKSDPTHAGPAGPDTIRTASTADFTSFGTPRNYIEPKGIYARNLIDQEFQQTPDGLVRFIKGDGDANEVFQEISSGNSPFANDWKRVGTSVIKECAEGPASFRNNLEPTMYHLWLDHYGANGGQGSYVPYETTNIRAGGYTASRKGPNFPEGIRHGSVTPVTQAQYDALLGLVSCSKQTASISPGIKSKPGKTSKSRKTIKRHQLKRGTTHLSPQ